MLREHIKTDKNINFYISGKFIYSVNINGIVKKINKYTKEEEILKPFYKDKEKYIKIANKIFRLANIINFSFKGLNFNQFNTLINLDVSYIDGNPDNLHPSNIIWNNTNLETDKDGYRLIPGYSSYKIHKSGTKYINKYNVITELGKNKKEFSDSSYRYIPITDDLGNKKYVRVHFLVCLAFKQIPRNFFKLDINHIDANRYNNNVDNLEWCTRNENILHAFKNGLRTDNNIVLVRDYNTGKITEYFSQGECARQLGLNNQTVDNRVRSKGKKVFLDGKQYCRKKDFTNWDTDNTLNGYSYKITVINKNGKKMIYKSLAELQKHLHIPGYNFNTTKSLLLNKFKYKSVEVKKDYIFGKKPRRTLPLYFIEEKRNNKKFTDKVLY